VRWKDVTKIKDRIKEFRRVRASELRPNPANWRVHPQSQVRALRAILNEIGYADVLIARELPDGSLELVDGHLRAEESGPNDLLPVVVLDVTKEEANKLLLTIDPLAAMAETDTIRLKELLRTVRTDDEALQELFKRTAGERLWATLYPNELDEAEVSPDKAEELRQKWHTKLGQVWQAAQHRIVCADCTDGPEVARLWHKTSLRARLLWTDPPYGCHYANKNRFLNKSDRGNRIQKAIVNDHLSAEETGALFQKGLETAHSEHKVILHPYQQAFERKACCFERVDEMHQQWSARYSGVDARAGFAIARGGFEPFLEQGAGFFRG